LPSNGCPSAVTPARAETCLPWVAYRVHFCFSCAFV
jgi:hypothetical protein